MTIDVSTIESIAYPGNAVEKIKTLKHLMSFDNIN